MFSVQFFPAFRYFSESSRQLAPPTPALNHQPIFVWPRGCIVWGLPLKPCCAQQLLLLQHASRVLPSLFPLHLFQRPCENAGYDLLCCSADSS